jgi:hypothetical protein
MLISAATQKRTSYGRPKNSALAVGLCLAAFGGKSPDNRYGGQMEAQCVFTIEPVLPFKWRLAIRDAVTLARATTAAPGKRLLDADRAMTVVFVDIGDTHTRTSAPVHSTGRTPGSRSDVGSFLDYCFLQ